jgi:hypothetical protein
MAEGYVMTATIVGADRLAEAFAKSPEIVGENMRDALNRSAFKAESIAKQEAPVQYAHLRGSIHTQGATSTLLEARVGTNLDYAIHQEFGTGIYAGKGPIVPKRAKVLAWQSGGQWHFAKSVKGVQGKFFFKKAKEQSQPDMDRYIEDALNSIVTSLAQGT